MTVVWGTCGDDSHWCNLKTLNLNSHPFERKGVYIIWHEGNPGRVVRVGQGDLAGRLEAHRNDSEILQYAKRGTLRVTWAIVPHQGQRNGIERYLADYWKPLIGEHFPNVAPIAVNSPFD